MAAREMGTTNKTTKSKRIKIKVKAAAQVIRQTRTKNIILV